MLHKPAGWTRRIGTPKGTLPVVATSVAFLEQLVRRACVVGGVIPISGTRILSIEGTDEKMN